MSSLARSSGLCPVDLVGCHTGGGASFSAATGSVTTRVRDALSNLADPCSLSTWVVSIATVSTTIVGVAIVSVAIVSVAIY